MSTTSSHLQRPIGSVSHFGGRKICYRRSWIVRDDLESREILQNLENVQLHSKLPALN